MIRNVMALKYQDKHGDLNKNLWQNCMDNLIYMDQMTGWYGKLQFQSIVLLTALHCASCLSFDTSVTLSLLPQMFVGVFGATFA